MVMVVVMMVMRGPGAVRRCGSRNKGDRSGQEQRGEYFLTMSVLRSSAPCQKADVRQK